MPSSAPAQLPVGPRQTRHRALSLWVPALLVSAAALVTLWIKGGWPVDLEVYRWGGQLVADGDSLYAPREGLPFTYPPFAALLFVPLALAPRAVALGLVVLGSALGLVVVLRRALEGSREGSLGFLGRRLAPTWKVLGVLAVAVVVCEPVWQTFSFGQVNLLLAGLLAADLLRRGDRPWRGVWLGVAAGIKLTPIFLVAWLVLSRQWRAAGVAIGSMLATVAIGFLLLPGNSRAFWTEVLPETGRIGAPSYVANQSVKGVLARFLGDEAPALDPAWFGISLVVGLVLVLAAARLAALGDRSAGLWVASLGMLLASPVSWSHHWVWLVPLALAVLCSAARDDVPRVAHWATGGMLAAAVLQVIWWVPSRDGRELEWNAWQMVLGNAYVWGGLLLTLALVPLALRQVRELLAGRGGVGSDA
ncbi:glycosyltransferase 87 family protein [Kytococcus sedentarius]|uniref:glycosyltransferase 87 family protein n=1 Tax=Kytococcus sedentarius TaxID=1276 RepID=UPI0035BC2BC9